MQGAHNNDGNYGCCNRNGTTRRRVPPLRRRAIGHSAHSQEDLDVYNTPPQVTTHLNDLEQTNFNNYMGPDALQYLVNPNQTVFTNARRIEATLLKILNKVCQRVTLYVPLQFIIGDVDGSDHLCSRFTYRGNACKQLC
jgi:hypothetical protein